MAMWVSRPNTCWLENPEPILVSERGTVCIRVCSHVRSRLPPRSPASAPAFAKSPASWIGAAYGGFVVHKSNCGALLDGNAGMEHKKTGFTIIYRCKKIVLWKNINIFANYLRGVLEKWCDELSVACCGMSQVCKWDVVTCFLAFWETQFSTRYAPGDQLGLQNVGNCLILAGRSSWAGWDYQEKNWAFGRLLDARIFEMNFICKKN